MSPSEAAPTPKPSPASAGSIFNAGGSTSQDGPVTEAPEEEFWRAIKLDLFGTFLCSKIAIPYIIKGGGGSVINMASNVALMALPGRDCYTAAKGGVASMTRSMAVEYAPHKIRVNAIAPSVTLTERVKRLLSGNEHLNKHLQPSPRPRTTDPRGQHGGLSGLR